MKVNILNMKTNDKRNDIEQCKNDIIYFVKNVMQLDLKPHEELLLKNLIEAKKTGKDLMFGFVPHTSQNVSEYSNYNNQQYGTSTKFVVIDEPNDK